MTASGVSSETDIAPGRYTPLRLHTETVQLISDAHSILPHCEVFGSITIDVQFDLRIPGWLPPTHVSRHTSNTYGVVATAKVGWANESMLSAIDYLSPLCHADGEFALARLSRSAYNAVHIRRHSLPTAVSEAKQVRQAQYTLRSRALPVEVIIKHAEDIDLHDPSGIKMEMLLRTCHQKPWDDHEAATSDDVEMRVDASPSDSSNSPSKTVFKKNEIVAHVVHLAMEIEEREDFRSIAFNSFTAAFPLPADQPTRGDMLLGPSRAPLNPMPLLPDVVDPIRMRYHRRCLLLPNDEPQGHTFATPRAIVAATSRIKGTLTFADWGGRLPHPDVSGPFARVSHFLKTHVTFLLSTGETVVSLRRNSC